MSFKQTGAKSRPDPVRPPIHASDPTPIPPSWSALSNKTNSNRRNSTSSASSQSSTPSIYEDPHLPAAEEAAALSTSHALKNDANTHFAKQDYSQAISTYDRALAECPQYLDYEIAVLQSNIAACHLNLKEWKEAADAASKALDGLEREDPLPKPKDKAKDTTNTDEDNNGIIELPDDETDTAAALHRLVLSDQRKADIRRIRTKALLRRARANHSYAHALQSQSQSQSQSPPTKSTSVFATASSDPSIWSLLSSTQADYTLLSSPPFRATLPPADLRTVDSALRTLPAEVKAAQEKETAEMLGKLKELGNGLLKPFGLSTDMFKFEKNEGEGGGYSVNFGK